ncbi:hypothetical protein CCR94_16265 [Rhodoblastus sphagnicola]|uniref:Uncharacterized protein n=1 Tax=Rhodoblastus sphagnicola TaxID=333368 RepID=A0A2S6N2U2_9HYPH|nr:hypothetical protein [Rhodoblastus sphagnicola]MBB4199048.1 hypothetical protein [Rhodoblastus sphagnicola]PPQ28944.1 hypothetical protein CCR94_16265 [Rhodoblastus sphagnicola]
MRYTPPAWFWSGQPVGETSPVIYSSAKGALVAATDANYLAFVAARGGVAPAWPVDETGAATFAALDAVLIAAGLPATGLAAPTLPQMRAAVIAAAGAACAAIVTQITPDANHTTAYANAASILNSNAGDAPTADPLKTAFANLAAAFGASSASVFAARVLGVQKASLDLLAAQTALTASANAATAAQGASGSLASALAAFETALGAVAAELNAAGATISTPAAITIAGVNA